MVVRLVEAEDRALHVGQAVRRVRPPDQDAFAARRLPAEQPGQVFPADEVGHGAAGPVVRHGQVADAVVGEDVGQAHHLAGHVRLHGRGDVDAVPVTQLGHRAQQFVQFVGGAGLGVQVERHGRQFDASLAYPVQEALHLAAGPVGPPVLEGVEALDGPAETSRLRPVVGVAAQFEERVEVGAALGHHPALRVGVADVQVGVLHQVQRPVALRPGLEGDLGSLFEFREFDQERGGCVHFRDQETGVVSRSRHGLAADGGAPGGADAGSGDARSRVRASGVQYPDPDGLQQSARPVVAQQRLSRQPHLAAAEAGGGGHALLQEVARDVGVPPGRPGQRWLGHGA